MKRISLLVISFMLISCLISGIALAEKVSIITWETATATAIKALIPEFEKETGINVSMEMLPESVLREKVVLDLASGTGAYDIFLVGNWVLAEYAEAGFLQPLDDLIANNASDYSSIDDFGATYLDALRYKGSLYALPYYGHVGVLMYRKDWFEEKGIKVPQTTEELLETAKAFYDPPNRYGVAIRAKRGEDNPIITTSFTWIYGGEWLNEENYPTVNEPEFIEGVKYVRDLLKYAPPDVSRYGWVEVENSFTSGKVAMIMDASDFIGRIENPESSKIAGKIGYALIPEGPFAPSEERYASHLFTAGMGINADSSNIDAAWKFLQWMTSTKIQLRTAMEGHNTGITSVTVLESEEFMNAYPGIDVMLKALEYSNPNYMPHISCYTELCDIIGTHISGVVAGTEDPEKAMNAANTEMLKVLERTGNIKK